MGTLRRSTAPQSQFESPISEPEKNHCIPKYKTVNDVSHAKNESNEASQVPHPVHFLKHSDIANATRRSCHSCDYQREAQTGGNKINSKLKTLDRRIAKSEYNISSRDDEDASDFEEYFHKSSRAMTMGRLRSIEARHHFRDETEGNGVVRLSKDEENRLARKWGTIDLQRGHVGQKISAYEENARRSGRNWEYSDRYQVLPEMKKHRTIGVPLVGMHNACGLPVVASWPEHELLEPLRVRSRVIGTLRPIFKTPRTSDGRHRTHPKRKAPQPGQIMSRKKYEAEKMKSFDKQVEYPSIKSLVSLDPEACEARKRRRKRPSFKAKKIGTFSSKNSMRHTCKSHIKRNKENSMAESARKVYQDENSKRQTLYARDDGDDAVQVLKNLCLNPLARTKSESDMIW